MSCFLSSFLLWKNCCNSLHKPVSDILKTFHTCANTGYPSSNFDISCPWTSSLPALQCSDLHLTQSVCSAGSLALSFNDIPVGIQNLTESLHHLCLLWIKRLFLHWSWMIWMCTFPKLKLRFALDLNIDRESNLQSTSSWKCRTGCNSRDCRWRRQRNLKATLQLLRRRVKLTKFWTSSEGHRLESIDTKCNCFPYRTKIFKMCNAFFQVLWGVDSIVVSLGCSRIWRDPKWLPYHWAASLQIIGMSITMKLREVPGTPVRIGLTATQHGPDCLRFKIWEFCQTLKDAATKYYLIRLRFSKLKHIGTCSAKMKHHNLQLYILLNGFPITFQPNEAMLPTVGKSLVFHTWHRTTTSVPMMKWEGDQDIAVAPKKICAGCWGYLQALA